MDCSIPGSSVLHCLPDLLKFMFIESVMLSHHLILCSPLLHLPSIFPSIRVFSSESTFHDRFKLLTLKFIQDDITLMAESKEELKSLLMKVKEESEKVG